MDINPTSQINYLKAGINIEGYEHIIMRFRRQMYVNHEDMTKLPGSLLINSNGSQFRIFLTDDSITCYTCKAIGHTSNTCKKYRINEVNLPNRYDHYPNTLQEYPQEEVSEMIESSILPLPTLKLDSSNDKHMDWLEDTVIPTDIMTTPTSPTAPISLNSPKEEQNKCTLQTSDHVNNIQNHNSPPLSKTNINKNPYPKHLRNKNQPIGLILQLPL